MRLSPPVVESTGHNDYRVTLTTPYMLLNASRDEWTAYLNRNLAADQPRAKAMQRFLKHGPSRDHWHEFIFQAYARHQADAICLTGLPDVKSSLPHAT